MMNDQVDQTRPYRQLPNRREPSRYDLCIHCGHTAEPHLPPEYARSKGEPVCEQCDWLGNKVTGGRECSGYEREVDTDGRMDSWSNDSRSSSTVPAATSSTTQTTPAPGVARGISTSADHAERGSTSSEPTSWPTPSGPFAPDRPLCGNRFPHPSHYVQPSIMRCFGVVAW